MHTLFQSAVLLAGKTTTTTKAAPASGGSSFLILIVALFAMVYFFVLRPRQRKMRAQGGTNKLLGVGDAVITAGGILGTVTAVEGDEITVEVAPGNEMTFWRRAVNLRSSVSGAPPVRPPAGPDWDDESSTGEESMEDGDLAGAHDLAGSYGTPVDHDEDGDETGGVSGWEDEPLAGDAEGGEAGPGGAAGDPVHSDGAGEAG